MTRLHIFVGAAAMIAAAALASAETRELKLIPANVHWGYFDSRVKAGSEDRLRRHGARGDHARRRTGSAETRGCS
jgi:hypothetical protein